MKSLKHLIRSYASESDPSRHTKQLITLPPLIDSRLFRMQFAAILLIIPTRILAKNAFRATTFTNILNDLVALLSVSSLATVIVTIVIRINQTKRHEPSDE